MIVVVVDPAASNEINERFNPPEWAGRMEWIRFDLMNEQFGSDE